MDEWVVRGGIAVPKYLSAGYAEHKKAPGVYGFSVQYQPGISIDDLAQAGQFPNAEISYAQKVALEVAVQQFGYTMELRRTPGIGYHHTLIVLYDASRQMIHSLQQLPHVTQAISDAFQQQSNPHRVKRKNP